jgi:hypothetical protein
VTHCRVNAYPLTPFLHQSILRRRYRARAWNRSRQVGLWTEICINWPLNAQHPPATTSAPPQSAPRKNPFTARSKILSLPLSETYPKISNPSVCPRSTLTS